MLYFIIIFIISHFTIFNNFKNFIIFSVHRVIKTSTQWHWFHIKVFIFVSLPNYSVFIPIILVFLKFVLINSPDWVTSSISIYYYTFKLLIFNWIWNSSIYILYWKLMNHGVQQFQCIEFFFNLWTFCNFDIT